MNLNHIQTTQAHIQNASDKYQIGGRAAVGRPAPPTWYVWDASDICV